MKNPVSGHSLSASQVLQYAEMLARNGTDVGVNMCQRFVRMAFGGPGGIENAADAWRAARYKHTNGTPPPGAAVFWGGGAGHVAISAGNGMVYSTDIGDNLGKVSLVDMDYITKQWGKPLLGWSEDENGRKITSFDAKPVKAGAGGGGVPTYTTAGGGVATGYSKKELRRRYGYIADVYEGVPEIQKLVKRAIRAKWDPDTEFARRFQDTKWWKNHTEEERQFVLKEATQPGEAADEIKKQRADVVNLYRNMGVPIAPDRVDKIARSAVVHGWTQQQLVNKVAAEFDYSPDKTFGGVAGQTIDQFRDMSNAYLVPLSGKTLDQWTQNVLRGEADTSSFESYLKDQAKSLFPEMSNAIDRGVTPEDYLSPYKETAANTLGINPDSINWFDPKWSQAVFRTDPKTGERGLMGLSDWGRTLRTDSSFGFDHTEGARDNAAQFADKLANLFAGA